MCHCNPESLQEDSQSQIVCLRNPGEAAAEAHDGPTMSSQEAATEKFLLFHFANRWGGKTKSCPPRILSKSSHDSWTVKNECVFQVLLLTLRVLLGMPPEVCKGWILPQWKAIEMKMANGLSTFQRLPLMKWSSNKHNCDPSLFLKGINQRVSSGSGRPNSPLTLKVQMLWETWNMLKFVEKDNAVFFDASKASKIKVHLFLSRSDRAAFPRSREGECDRTRASRRLRTWVRSRNCPADREGDWRLAKNGKNDEFRWTKIWPDFKRLRWFRIFGKINLPFNGGHSWDSHRLAD